MKLKTHLHFLIFFIFCGLKAVYGQGLCDRGGGGFTLDKYEGCSPVTVKISNSVVNSVDAGYVTSYDGVSQQGLAFSDLLPNLTHTYGVAGDYQILQKVNTSTGQVLYHCEKVKVIESRGVNHVLTACGGGKVSLLLMQDIILNGYEAVEINWGDGSNAQYWRKGDALNVEHTYASTNGRPIMKVKGLYSGTAICKEGYTLELPVTFQQAQLGDIQLTAIEMRQNGNLNFSYNGIGGIKTQVKYSKDGGNQYTSGNNWSLNGPQTYNIPGLDISAPYKVKLSSEDNCAGQLDSDVVTTMVIRGESTNGSIKLSWNKYDETATGFQGYDLYANGELLKSFNSINDTEYTDTDVECGSFVAYHIVAKLTNLTSQSAPIGIKVETDANSLIESALVTVAYDGIIILADVPGKSYNLNIERSENGSSSYKRIMTLPNVSEYIDMDVKPDEKSYCYRFSYESCDVKYPFSEPICTILLKKDLSLFSWSAEPPFLDDFGNYTISQAPLYGPVTTETDRQQNLTFTPQLGNQSEQEYRFFVKAISKDGKFVSQSNMVTYRRGAGVFVPTAFTPNDDPHNSTLRVVGEQVKSFDFTIMNRWGNVVFHTSNLAEGWDGKINGTNAAVGSYIYKIEFVDNIDQKVEKRGTFMLLR